KPLKSSVSDRAISLLSVRTWITPSLYRPEQQHVDTFSPSPLKGLCGISMLFFGGYHSNRAILASIRCQAYRFAKSFANLSITWRLCLIIVAAQWKNSMRNLAIVYP